MSNNLMPNSHNDINRELEELLRRFRSPLIYNPPNGVSLGNGISPSPLMKFNLFEEDINRNKQLNAPREPRESFLGLRRKKSSEQTLNFPSNSLNVNFILDSPETLDQTYPTFDFSKEIMITNQNENDKNKVYRKINTNKSFKSSTKRSIETNHESINQNQDISKFESFNSQQLAFFGNINDKIDIKNEKLHLRKSPDLNLKNDKRKTSLIFDKLEAKFKSKPNTQSFTNPTPAKKRKDSNGSQFILNDDNSSIEENINKDNQMKVDSHIEMTTDMNIFYDSAKDTNEDNSEYGYGYLENFYLKKSETTDNKANTETSNEYTIVEGISLNENSKVTTKKLSEDIDIKKRKKVDFKPNKLLFYSEKPRSAKQSLSTSDKDQASKNLCSCKNTQCIKLYCECFRNNKYCIDCSCVNCFNLPDYEEIREKATKYLKKRNKNAFVPKLKESVDETGAYKQHLKGCKCKNSSCLKNYCECFQLGVCCSATCKCSDCKNDVLLEGDKAEKREMNHNLYNNSK